MKFIILWIFLLPSIFLRAQSSFFGTVQDEKENELPGAQVVLYRADSLYAAALTDAKGQFAFRDLPEGPYDLLIQLAGFTPLEETRTIRGNQSFRFSLFPEMSAELAEVEVVANRNDQVERTATGQIFYLSEQARKSGDPYKALREIPRLISNEATKSVSMEDGSAPLILINGIAVNSGIAPIDPSDIEAVEIMDVVNARYLRTGARHILNIKLKKERTPYRYFEAMTRHDVPLRQGSGAIYFEFGNAKYSLYGRGAADYVYHDDSEFASAQQGLNYFKQSKGTSQTNRHSFLGELLFKWWIASKDYLAFHLYANNKYSDSEASGEGSYQTASPQDFRSFSTNLDRTNLLTASLYHQHRFSDRQTLETTLAYNKNWNKYEGERTEDYAAWLYRNLYRYDNHRESGSLNIDFSWDIDERNSLNIGNETRYVNDKIDEVSSLNPVFRHREWSEYLYAVFSGGVKDRFFYMLSAGFEGIWLKVGARNSHYFKPRAAASGTYSFDDHNSVSLSYTLTNQAPSVGQLNPYNTSTDSLVRTVGNPDLLPVQSHSFEFSYTFNTRGLYLTPYAGYVLFTDIIEPYGFSENDIYTSTFRNSGRFKALTLGGSASYRLGNWGRIYGNAYHLVDYFEGQEPLKSVMLGGGLSANYKKWSFYGDVSWKNYTYTATTHARYHSPGYSSIQINYNFTPGFYIAVALQYLHGKKPTETWTDGADYHAWSSSTPCDASLRPWILIRYTFRKNVKKKIHLDNVVRSRESGIEL